ncbi:MAG: CdaR family protein, partial [candidate division WOR-3 bacterium]
NFFKTNISLKLISLLIGFLIWFYAFIQEDLVITFPVRVNIITDDEDMTFFIYDGSKIEIEFSGKRKDFMMMKLLKNFPQYEIRVENYDLRENEEELNFDNLLIPQQVNLVPIKFKGKRILKYYIDRKITKDVNVVLKFKGVLNQNISFYKDVEFEPKRIKISGPEILIKDLDFVESEEIDLSELKKSLSLKTKLKKISEFIEYETHYINVNFFIERKIAKIFQDVPVLFVNKNKNLKILPDSLSATVEVEGPESLIKNMLPGELTLTIDLSSIEKKGEYILRVNQPIKEFVRIKNVNPSEIKVVVR